MGIRPYFPVYFTPWDPECFPVVCQEVFESPIGVYFMMTVSIQVFGATEDGLMILVKDFVAIDALLE